MTPSQICTHIALAEMRGTTLEELKNMLADEDFGQPDDHGTYPLHEIGLVSRDLVDFAVDRGADVNVRNGQGHTPLDIAIAHKNETVVASLLRHNARLDLSDRYGNLPLMSAVLVGTKARGIIKMLLDAGADPDAKGANGRSAREIETWPKLAPPDRV